MSYGTAPRAFAVGEGTAVIHLDARAFRNGLVSVDALEWQPTHLKLPFVLVAGAHELRKLDAAGNVTPLPFTVTDAGTVTYSGTAFSGSGTGTLTLP